jgi:hypothetical protein
VTGSEVIEEIKRLPQQERRKVLEYTRTADTDQLSPEELEEVARQMVEAVDPVEKQRLKAEFIRGFYGNEPHA